MSSPEVLTPITVVTACMRSDGVSTFALTEVKVTADEMANGVHYLLTEDQLVHRGFEEPFVHFAEDEAPCFLVDAIRQFVATSMTVPHLIIDNPPEEP